MNKDIHDKIATIQQEVYLLEAQKRARLRGSSAYKRLAHKIHSKEKKLSYLRKCVREYEAQHKQEQIRSLFNGSPKTLRSQQREGQAQVLPLVNDTEVSA